MKPVVAWAVVAVLAGLNAAALLAPWPVLVVLSAASLAALRKGRRGFAVFTGLSLLINTLLLAWLSPGPDTVSLGPLTLGRAGAWTGLVGGLRLVSVVGANLAVLSWAVPARLLEGLRLGRRPTGFVAAVLIASQDIGRDMANLRDARRLEGSWPQSRMARVRAAAGLLPALLVAAHRRARVRRDALWLAGITTGPRFAPVVAVTALAVAGRMAFVALPNISLVFVLVFLGGIAFGARVGAWAGLWSMVLTDLLLTGLLPSAFANAPAMALVGAAGGWLRPLVAAGEPPAAVALAATAGIVTTLLFSVLTDVLTWLMVGEFRGNVPFLGVLVAAGLAFNAVPALTNAALFAASAGPVARAFQALRAAPGRQPSTST